jgi:hypothetical protein
MPLSPDPWPYAVTLDEALQTVITARQQYSIVHTQVQQLREAWASQYAPLLQEEALQKQTVHQVEAMLRALAVEIYQSTDRKEIAPGVKVREMTRLIYDPQEALTWAITHQMALILDVKAFEQLAKVTALPFVTRTTALQATLSPCLPGEQPASTAIQEASSQSTPQCASPDATFNRADREETYGSHGSLEDVV